MMTKKTALLYFLHFLLSDRYSAGVAMNASMYVPT